MGPGVKSVNIFAQTVHGLDYCPLRARFNTLYQHPHPIIRFTRVCESMRVSSASVFLTRHLIVGWYSGRGRRYDGTSARTGPPRTKKLEKQI